MLNPEHVPDVDPDERLARYVLQQRHVRKNGTLRQDAFIPHPHKELSVTRHRAASDDELWVVGRDVALVREKQLYGRGDLTATSCTDQKLRVLPDPIPKNANHAKITDWPETKPAQKLIALELAASADYLEAPQ